ncbi:MAG: NAD-dependent epimerase/dehydratase family protein [Methyloceanibacter sp.]
MSNALKILVTGGSGFIGRHLCRRLLHDGHDVHATSRRVILGHAPGLTWHVADFADVAAAHRVMTAVKPDIVYHLAGAVGASPDPALVLPTLHSLLTSTVNLLLAARKCDCRRVILSGSLTEPTVDGDGTTPQAPYAAAKWAAAGYARMFYSLYGTPVVLLRPFMTYGPGQARTKLIPSVTLSLLRREPPRLSSGRYSSDWVYIADVIEGFVAAATTPGIEGKTIDLGTGHLVPMTDIVDRLVTIVGHDVTPEFGALPDRPGENLVSADTSVAAEDLGWQAKTPLEAGLRKTVSWYRLAKDAVLPNLVGNAFAYKGLEALQLIV